MAQLSVFSLLVKLSVVLVDRVKAAPKRWYSHLLLSFLILFDGRNHTVAFALVGKQIPHVALPGKGVRFQHFLGADGIRVGCRCKTQSALTELASDAQTHDGHGVCCRFSGGRKNRAFHFQHTLEGHLQHRGSGRVTGPTRGIPIVERRSRCRSCFRDVGGGILSFKQKDAVIHHGTTPHGTRFVRRCIVGKPGGGTDV